MTLRPLPEDQRRQSHVDRHPTLYIAGPPVALLVTAYVMTGHIWIALGIALVVACMALGAALSDTLEKLGQAMAENAALEAECDEHAAVSASLAQQLAEAQIAGGVVLPFPSIPKQRLPMSREEWDAVEAETVVHDAWLERLVTQADPFEDGAS